MIVLLVLTLSITLISASNFGNQENIFYVDNGIVVIPSQLVIVKQNTPMDLHLHVFNTSNGVYLTNITAACGIHVHNPLGEHILIQAPLSYNLTEGAFDIKFDANNFTVLGTYNYVIECLTGTASGEASANFEVTSSGEKLDILQGIILIAQLGIVALFFGFGRVFQKGKWKIALAFDVLAMLMGVILLNSMRLLAIQSSDLGKMAAIGLIIGIIILLFLFLYLFIYQMVSLFRHFKEKRNMKWGINDQPY